MSHDWPRRGEIRLAAMPDETKQRPCLILSADWLNQYALDVTVVPITSIARGHFPTRVPIPAGEGGLRVDSLEALLKGGTTGPALVAGKTGESLMVKRLLLPLDHEEHMPPEGKPQPTPAEITILQWWTESGTRPQ